MEIKIREAQNRILKLFSKKSRSFALSGGSALEIYYLKHRFSFDLDFFSPKYSLKEIDDIISEFRKFNNRIKLESEFISKNRAKVRFYSMPVTGSDSLLKIDFIEDVLFKNPQIRRFKDVPVYSVGNIYYQKIAAIAGTNLKENEVGRQILVGARQEARDVFDIYMLSKKVKPLNKFMERVPRYLQRGIVQWYQAFSRQDIKLGLLELDIYYKEFDAKEMIIYLENEIREFIKKELL